MKRKITICLFGLAVAVSLVLYSGALSHATSMSAVPTILFGQEDDPDGTYAFNYFGPSSDPSFQIAASIAAIEGIDFNGIGDPEVILATSRLEIYGRLQSVDQVDDNKNSTITASFTTTTDKENYPFDSLVAYGELDPDEYLLTGDLINMQITGEEDATTVKASAIFELTGGLLLDQFGSEAQLSADIDLIDAEFSAKLFQNYFSGTIAKGKINSNQAPEPVPEPGTLILMSLGWVGLITYRRRKAK